MITQLLLDLDNTLYSARYGLEDRVHRRLMEYCARFLGLSVEEAAALREKRIARYGTSLEWLQKEFGFTDTEGYFRAVHPADEAEGLPFNPELRPFLESLKLPLALLTNAPMEHAERILRVLQVRDLFPHIFDIWSNGLQGKPHREAFLRPLRVLGKSPEETLFVDDYPKYVRGFCALGGQGVLIDEEGRFPDFPGNRILRLEELKGFI